MRSTSQPGPNSQKNRRRQDRLLRAAVGLNPEEGRELAVHRGSSAIKPTTAVVGGRARQYGGAVGPETRSAIPAATLSASARPERVSTR